MAKNFVSFDLANIVNPEGHRHHNSTFVGLDIHRSRIVSFERYEDPPGDFKIILNIDNSQTALELVFDNSIDYEKMLTDIDG